MFETEMYHNDGLESSPQIKCRVFKIGSSAEGAPFSFPPSPLSQSVSVQNLQDRSCFIMYEFWQDRLSWMR